MSNNGNQFFTNIYHAAATDEKARYGGKIVHDSYYFECPGQDLETNQCMPMHAHTARNATKETFSTQHFLNLCSTNLFLFLLD